MITEWVDGTPLLGSSPREADKDRAGGHLVRLFLASPSRVGRIHGDPHPGNFRLLSDGRLAVLDFGSTGPLASGWPPGLGRLARAGRDRDATSLHEEAVAADLLGPADIPATDLLQPRLRRFFTFFSSATGRARGTPGFTMATYQHVLPGMQRGAADTFAVSSSFHRIHPVEAPKREEALPTGRASHQDLHGGGGRI